MRFLKAFGTFYIVTAGLVGMFYYLSYRIDCIKSDGFFNAFTGECKITGFNMVTRLPPGLIESQLKGLMWGYDLIVAVANGQQLSDTQHKKVLIEVQKAIANGDKDVIKYVDQVAQNILKVQKSKIGQAIDKDTRMTAAYLTNKTIFIDFRIETKEAFSVLKRTKELFSAVTKKQFCHDEFSNHRRTLDLIFIANYKFQLRFRTMGESEEIVVPIDSCD